MDLSNALLSEFVKLTQTEKPTSNESTHNGSIVNYNGKQYVKLDGSELLTPIQTTSNNKDGDRVVVLLKDHTATVIGNMTSPSVNNTDFLVVQELIAEELEANTALINELHANNVIIGERLSASEASIKVLDSIKLNASTAKVTYATIDNLETERARIAILEAGQMGADSAYIKQLQADIAEINTLIFGTASGEVIHSEFANAVIAQLGNVQIKSAMIESVAADKITAGDIITNNVRVKSRNGALLISDETIQISDANQVRVQIGKDANNDYSINIWDDIGNLMFSKGGITDNAIKDAIIRNDMVSDTANISAHKLDIDSLFEEINGSTKTIRSSRVYLDSESQTLDVAFVDMSSVVGGLRNDVTTHGTAINIIQGQITEKVWLQDIDELNGGLLTQYSELVQTTDGLTARVSVIETDMATDDDISAIQSNLEGTETRVSTTESLIQQLTNSISMLVTDGDGQSLMTQTETGWTFSTETIQNMVNSTSETLASLVDEVGDVTSTVDVLQQAVTDIGVLTDYVKIGTYENEPCIELGESDSDFKLVITNTRIMFMEGSGVPAYINNQSLFIKKAVIEEELQQGQFVWKARANGNLGLVWKGAAN